MGVFTFIDSIQNKDIFNYIVILLISVFIFLRLTIGLNIFLALILGTLIILYLNEKKDVEIKTEEAQNKLKYDTIKPKLDIVPPDNTIIDFLFSVQDFYVYNPMAYEEMVDNLKSFFQLNQDIFEEKQMYTYFYQIAESKKNNAINAFQSIIFKLPTEKAFTDKFNRAHVRLETILNKYMNDIYDKCQSNIIKDGRNTITRPIRKGPVGHNVYDDEKFSYQFY